MKNPIITTDTYSTSWFSKDIGQTVSMNNRRTIYIDKLPVPRNKNQNLFV